jgi:hypothetical protein
MKIYLTFKDCNIYLFIYLFIYLLCKSYTCENMHTEKKICIYIQKKICICIYMYCTEQLIVNNSFEHMARSFITLVQ